MIIIKTKEEIKIMKEGGKILAEILKKLSSAAKVGITIWSLEELARKITEEAGAEPAFLGYHDYPSALCVSINEEIVHCLPSKRKIAGGDLVSLDFGIRYKGLNVDSAETVLVKPIENNQEPEVKEKLIKVTRESLNKGIKMAKVGNTVGDIGSAIQKYAEKNGFSVIRDLVGHGIGKELHEEPEVPNFGKPGKGPVLKEGMVIAIEPMLSAGSYEVIEDKNTLAWKTKDNSLSAHFEHTVAITKNGSLVLTE
ncbi:MAG: type I methionyl aminopeptidase [Parcubacteria group bacterium RIFCSPLOWO2_01_FULL_40_65]|nr:MAG: type I methionyl aminopeptidase [Parcubacteria group bacterium RIFCSPHIGHO2_01_FULL_40_30]OHB19859.1 MAG: type I methionyl aminopeptidase [Parcubacteria group bacterium RIFCSPHIGHO2_02_FULL_40_12]OHB21570.1 MAG: type I methionyl aminopeptidase [Parcubacteria group bacterium RIFCSPLOWO2_01_FULL_40_65]OHB23504.1 MAG: type I methionyl aminopeptidase [Parcubacteria group bacterium RIFCSPLOWO2_02_FULL_40_12]OHB24021.1 MAG: type I methionyl aminopeptidase [Parcubacteria group bacterium RIFCSP